ncbi:putative xanthine dehydrogenase [Rhizophagus irregularis]|uniref:xanthine dehydrogenase n=1 Tax=Rhizophagus irregularis TaxID=588596 RepID=A0A2N0PV31_9GLOM|nr:putative xanthine dehydrogenase [Rhizophagus irregularis]
MNKLIIDGKTQTFNVEEEDFITENNIKFFKKLRFYLNGAFVEIDNPDPDITLLEYVRSIGLTGTKLGCAEGGCGACTVLISSYDPTNQRISHYSVNACLAPLCSVDGKHVITIEGIGNVKNPHPVQVRSQCGFCTPGIAMSLYALLRNNPNPSEEEIEECFDGNLCRCTGYRPILDAAKTFAKPTNKCCNNDVDKKSDGIKQNSVRGCGREDCCKFNNSNFSSIIDHKFPQIKFKQYDATQELIFPPALISSYKPYPLYFSGRKTKWFKPNSLNELLLLKLKYPQGKLVSGNSEVGIEVKFKKINYNILIFVGDLNELRGYEFTDDGLIIGANTTLAQFQEILQKASKHYKEYQVETFRAILANLRWFAGHQIRNVATPAGNIITGSPISDLNPIFLSASCIFTLSRHKEMPYDTSFSNNFNCVDRKVLAKEFWTGYRQNTCTSTEIITKIFIPLSKERQFVRAYKQSKRRDDDIAIVNAGLMVHLDNEDVVKDVGFGFGGMRSVSVRAPLSEEWLIGKKWGDKNVLKKLLNKLGEELQLSFDVPGGMASYRKSLVSGFIYKFWYDVCKNVFILTEEYIDNDIDDFIGIIERNVSKGVQTVGFKEINKKIVGKEIPHLSAMKQVTGEAIYTDDLPKVHDELYGALVLSQNAHAKILSVDASKALAISEVKGFFTAKDVPGENKWGPIFHDEEVFVSEEAQCVGQIIGLIVAESKAIAQEAALLVEVKYEKLPHILTIEEAIDQNSFFNIERKMIKGDVDEAFRHSDHVFEGETRIGGQEHFYLETNASLVIPKSEDNEFEVHASTQNLTETQIIGASVLGIAANKIVCKVKRLGGGFGGKETRSIPLTLALMVGAYHLKRPIRCMLDRDEDIIISGQRHPFLGKWKVGVNDDGKLQALDLRIYNNAGWSADLSSAVLERAITHSDNCYYIPNIRIIGKMCKTNTHSNTAFRGFGGPQGMMITENIISEVADKLGTDVVEFREKNFYSEGQLTHFNMKLNDWHIPSMYEQVKISSEYVRRRQEINEFNEKHKWRKRGLSLIPTKFGLSFTALHLNQAGALVHIYIDGSILVSHGGVEMGQGLHTKMLQVAAEALDVSLNDVHLMETATNVVINTSSTAASVSSDINGYAVLNACKVLSERLKPYREKMPDKSFKEIVKAAYLDRVNLSANGFYKTPDIGYDWDKNEGQMFLYFTTGAACTEVEIDVLTGDHTILRTDLIMDIGRSLNYAIDVGQIEGAFIQGVGWCTIEESLFLPNGHIFTKGPGNYKLPGFRDIPQDFRVTTFRDGEYPNLKTIHSSKGVGEPPLFLGSSVFFAIRDAIKFARKTNGNNETVVLRSPATPERIRMACMDEIVISNIVEPKENEKGWVIGV